MNKHKENTKNILCFLTLKKTREQSEHCTVHLTCLLACTHIFIYFKYVSGIYRDPETTEYSMYLVLFFNKGKDTHIKKNALAS